MEHGRKKIIFAANDAGGMDSLIPVIGRLLADGEYEVFCIAGGPAKKLLERNNFSFEDVDTMSDKALESRVVSVKPDLIFTGTSGGLTVEKKLLRIGQREHIPVVAIIDFWINYNLQFSFSSGAKAAPEDLPDYILVMDDLAKGEMIAEGFPKEKIIITGNPHFESFKTFPLPAPEAMKTIAFIDQDFSDLYKKGFHEDMGFDEIEVMRDLVRALNELGFEGRIVVKFHPSAKNRARYDEIAKGAKIEIVTSSTDTLDEVLTHSRLVIGMTSMALFEAALGGKMVISYQPHPKRKPDPLISNRLGLSHFAYTYEDFKKVLEKDLADENFVEKNQALIHRYTKNNATEEVIEVIDKIVSQKN